MVEKITNLVRRGKFAALSLLFAGTVMSGGAASLFAAPMASAQACDKVNIVNCGLTGSSLSGNIASFKAVYARGSDNGHNDLRQVFRWSGATDTSVAAMSTTNTKMGTLFRNGDIKVNGVVVGHDSWVAARFTEGAGFTQISTGVWARKTTTSFAQASSPVLVHYTADGSTADFAVMTNCGNAVKFTPVPKPQPKPQPQPVPQPKPQPQPQPKPESSTLKCEMVSGTLVGSSRTVVLNAKGSASASNTITKVVFDFGDGQSQTVNVAAGSTTATVQHTFAGTDVNFTVHATVFGADGTSATSDMCTFDVQPPAPETTPAVVECQPGVPEGSDECDNTPVVLGATDTTPPTPPTELVQTGAASVGAYVALFGATAVAGTMLYKLFSQRRLR